MGRHVTGVIVRRSCMGKKLSFADIRCSSPAEATDGKKEGSIVKIAFRRQEPAWNDAESPNPFPLKAADLPYGAVVRVEIVDGDPGTGNASNVMAWELLEDPHQTAEATAQVGEEELGGISYSTYLRERANRFREHTIKGQRIRANQAAGEKGGHHAKRPRTAAGNDTNARPPPAEATTSTDNDDLAQDGGHGDKLAKAMRAKLFASWLLEEFRLETSGTVLDVAGGKGQLSVELAEKGKVPCVVIDPLIRKKHCTNGTTSSFPVKRDAKKIRKAGGPLPRHLPTYFNQTSFLERYGKRKESNTTTQPYDGAEEDRDDSHLIQDCSTLIGLHPDQTTQDILEIALRYNKSVAIVPCCVFPSFFPLRQLKDGTMVNNHAQFCQFLCEMDSSLQTAVLPFSGRNVVVYRKLNDEGGDGKDGTD